MILWCDGAHGARENMRRDSSLLARLAARGGGTPGERDAEAVLRLFTFAPPGITLGRAQSPERWLDLDRCRADQVEWAVRPTGGRAIFHAEEWTYSLAARIDDPTWGGDLHASCARAAGVIRAALRALGVPVTLGPSAPHGAEAGGRPAAVPGPPDASRPSCFAATARHELSLGGRKLAGSAQRRTVTALLQQGSILLGDGHLRLADYLALGEGEREAARRALERHAAPAGRYLAGGHGLERLADALAGVLGPAVRRISGDEGVFLLTPEELSSYTAAFSN